MEEIKDTNLENTEKDKAEPSQQESTTVDNGNGADASEQTNSDIKKTEDIKGDDKNNAENKIEKEGNPAEEQLTMESYSDLGIKDSDKFKINEGFLNSYKEIALKHKINPEAAKEIAMLQQKAIEEDVKAIEELHKSWDKTLNETYGDNLKNIETKCGRVFAEIDDKDNSFKNLLATVGVEKAPATIAFLNKIGDLILEKGSISNKNNISNRERTLEDLY